MNGSDHRWPEDVDWDEDDTDDDWDNEESYPHD